MFAPKMKPAWLAVALGFLLLAVLWIVPSAHSTRAVCLVSNARTGVGSRSLQQAIDRAQAGDTLVVKGTCYGNSTIDKNLTLEGVSNKAFGVATLDGTGFTGNVLNIMPTGGGAVAIKNLTVRNGVSVGVECGFRFAEFGVSCALTNTTITGNGTGIYGQEGAHVTLTDSAVSSSDFDGIDTSGGVSLAHSSVTDNAQDGISGRGSAIALTDSSVVSGNGEGVRAIFGGVVTISDSTVSDNHGLGIYAQTQRVSINNSTVDGNGDSGIYSQRSDVTLAQTTVAGNENSGIYGTIFSTVALTQSTVTGNTGTDGGGLHIDIGSWLTVRGSSVSDNTASGKGGGIYFADNVNSTLLLSDSTVSNNSASSGGGIYLDSGTATLTGTNTMVNNLPDNCVGISGC